MRLTTLSISYNRWRSTATPIAAASPLRPTTQAVYWTSLPAVVPVTSSTKVPNHSRTGSAATATTNHRRCRRSTPVDLWYAATAWTTAATAHPPSVTVTGTTAASAMPPSTGGAQGLGSGTPLDSCAPSRTIHTTRHTISSVVVTRVSHTHTMSSGRASGKHSTSSGTRPNARTKPTVTNSSHTASSGVELAGLMPNVA